MTNRDEDGKPKSSLGQGYLPAEGEDLYKLSK